MMIRTLAVKILPPVILLAAALLASSGARAVSIAEEPLFISDYVPPNLMFMLDDSSSMGYDYVPDAIEGGGVKRLSPDFNKIYYNPQVDYQPWVGYDGTSFPAADPAPLSVIPPGLGLGGYWPLFYLYKGSGDAMVEANYIRYEIRYGHEGWRKDMASGPTGPYTRLTGFTWPNGKTRTVEEELQNYANWSAYYSTRMKTAKAAIGRAFVDASSDLRVGFGGINRGYRVVDGLGTPAIVLGVRPFNATNKQTFYDRLYGSVPEGTTPLRIALKSVGDYYVRADDRGPWDETPGESGSPRPDLECRQSYTLLMTDGEWNDDGLGLGAPLFSGVGNHDGTDGTTNLNPSGPDYTYTPADPYRDDWANTLADVAMLYWKNDLRVGLPNRVPPNDADPAFWQHMTTFTIGFGVEGTIDPAAAMASVATGTPIPWPQPSIPGLSSNPAKYDDLLHAGINGHGGYFAATDAETFTSGLRDTLESISGRQESSFSGAAANSTQLNTDTITYQARFDSRDWHGSLIAYRLHKDASGLVTPGSVVWDTDEAGAIPAPASRRIYTSRTGEPGGGLEFTAANFSELSGSQRAALNRNYLGVADGSGASRVSWLRGEAVPGMRARTQLLGDIVNASPVYVGAGDGGYAVLADDSGAHYRDFVERKKLRRKILYTGANDGMLHVFDANTGSELFAYVPKLLFSKLSRLTDRRYGRVGGPHHSAYVDGPIGVGDAYIDTGDGARWHTILVGALGAGGKGVYALDITEMPASGEPSSGAVYFDESKVLWEFSGSHIGNVMGAPQIVRLSDGTWAAVFGNGYNSGGDKARLIAVNLETGDLIADVNTGVGDGTHENGLGPVAGYDAGSRVFGDDSDAGTKVGDGFYAGDLQGNLWRFVLNGSSWESAYKTGSTPRPLFKARDASGNDQPITAQPRIGSAPVTSAGGVMVFFGTGSYFKSGDKGDNSVQSVYGIWDKGERITYASRDGVLQAQSLIIQSTNDLGRAIRGVSANTVDWVNKKGWYLDLIYSGSAQGERVIDAVLLKHGRVVVTTIVPHSDSCSVGGESWLLEIDQKSGGRLGYGVMDVDSMLGFDSMDYAGGSIPVSGVKLDFGMSRLPAWLDDTKGMAQKVYSGANTGGATGGMQVVSNKGTVGNPRVLWRQIFPEDK